jgi:hypothetical protein
VEFEERVLFLVDNFKKKKNEIIDRKENVVHKLMTEEKF